jgi:hypothetical protein
LRVQVGSDVLEQRFNFGLNAQVLWSPQRNRFALTGSNGGAVGQYETAIVTVRQNAIDWVDVTPSIERAFGHPVTCAYREPPNVGAVSWVSESRLLVAAQIMPHSVCDSMGTFVLYRFALSSKRIELRYGQLEAKKAWRTLLGPSLLAAPDDCVRRPRACFVPFNHQRRR